MLKILFMGTPDIAREALEKLYENAYEILGVVTVPDKKNGRGMKIAFSPVKEFALEKDIEVFQPESLRDNIDFIQRVRAMKPDVICVVAYGKILPEELLNIPQNGCINVHPSLLPKYRGPAPIQWAILNGDKMTGVTTMYMNNEMDAGDIILQETVLIGEDETTGDLWRRVSKIGAELLVKTMQQIESKESIQRKKQSLDYTLAPLLDKKMAKIKWDSMKGIEIKNLVRGLNPFMGAYAIYKNKKIKIWKVEILENSEKIGDIQDTKPGQILIANVKEGLYIKTKDSVIKVIEIQGENSKRMNIQEYLCGNNLELHTIME